MTKANPAHTTPHPDAELLAACARFRALNRHYHDLANSGIDDDAFATAWGAYEPEQKAVLDAICTARATTLPGIIARGVTLVQFAPDWAEPDMPGDFVDARQRAALLRDLVALGAGGTP